MPVDPKIWKITLPTDAKKRGKPDEYQLTDPDLKDSEWFERQPDGPIRFRAPVVGPTTPRSENIRSELRELKPDGKLAAWSSTDGQGHTCIVDVTPARIPSGNPGVGVVLEQIHDDDDDVVVWRVEASGLWLAIGDHRKDWKLVDRAYRPGTRLRLALAVKDGEVTAYRDGAPAHSFDKAFSGAYFRAGCYTQANAGAVPKNKTNYGEVIVHDVQVIHGPAVDLSAPVPAVPVSGKPACPHCGKPVTVTLNAG